MCKSSLLLHLEKITFTYYVLTFTVSGDFSKNLDDLFSFSDSEAYGVVLV